jgi:hypothetical protein
VAVAVLFQRLHLLSQRLLLRLFLGRRFLLELLVDFAPVLGVPRLVWLLVPTWYISFDQPDPYLAGLALYLRTVCFELDKLVWDLDLAEDGGEEGVGQVAYILQHVYVLHQPRFGEVEETRDRHGDCMRNWSALDRCSSEIVVGGRCEAKIAGRKRGELCMRWLCAFA